MLAGGGGVVALSLPPGTFRPPLSGWVAGVLLSWEDMVVASEEESGVMGCSRVGWS